MIYEKIKSQIIHGELLPGTFLSERAFANELKVSRTPVRAAIKQLAQDGWVNLEEHKRAVVSEITEKDVVELFLLREMIEPFAIRKIMECGKPALLAGMLATIANEMDGYKDDYVALMEKDMRFHSEIVNFAGIEKLSMIWQKLSDQMLRVSIYVMHPKRLPEDVLKEHRVIIDALWNVDISKALASLQAHHNNTFNAYKTRHFYESDLKVKASVQ